MPSPRQLCERPELAAARDEDVGLTREVGARRLVEDDHRQPVLAHDLVESGCLGERRRVHRSAAIGDVRAGDRHLRSLDDADPGHRPRPDGVLGAPCGEWAELQERRVWVDERLDAVTDQHLVAGAVTIDVALAADRRHRVQLGLRPVPTSAPSRPRLAR